MVNTIDTRIVLRHDTAENWELIKNNVDKALLVGEMGVEDDTGLFKIGKKHDTEDRLCTWAELEYANDVPDLTGVTNTVKQADSLDNLENGIVVGDIGIVKAPLFEGSTNYTYTGYVWNGTAWAAMDGNYNANNVFTSKAITLAGDFGKDSANHKITTIGNKKIGDVFEAGTSIQSILMGILSKTLQPSVTNPTAAISIASVTKKEVGETYTKPTATLTTNIGSYTYGPATGVTYDANNVRLVLGAEPGTLGDTKPTVPYKENDASIGAGSITLSASEYAANATTEYFTDNGQTYTFSGLAKNNAATAIAKDNLGDPSNPEKKVAANVVTVADKSSTIKGGRYCFYGVCNNTLTADNTSKGYYKRASFDIASLNSANVRSLKKTDLDGALPTTLEVPLDSTQVIFAAPAGKYSKLVAKDGAAQDATVSFDKKTGVPVEGAIAKIGETSTAKNYDVWHVTWTDPIASAKSLKLTWS